MSPFTPALFTFLDELADNNNREWFVPNKGRYQREVQDPLQAFARTLAPLFLKVDPLVAVDEKSAFRVYRDTRFSADKTPYKTHASAHFSLRSERGAHMPGYYLHLEPRGCFLGAGLWRPDPPVLAKVRAAIAARPDEWRAAVASVPPLAGESLVKAPRGFAPEHPMIEALRRKDFLTMVKLTEEEVCEPDFVAAFAEACRGMQPLVGFLNAAVQGP